ncbi:hypothetical protein [Novosphingobium beihaiensis]|uniref:Uncharacterized protein n=1 Tax=Novosphingobium beihaiensis TaxID=2930389 RepID=A0ABT0BUN3_9SPHN|nr:hypothetical protein [Novosphingobium beihaiensis]MCJ2188384.1 hypothetical protein [Novosphingobium beihaiensis]
MAGPRPGQSKALRGILQRMIGDFTMEESAFDRFVEDFCAAKAHWSTFEADALAILENAGIIRSAARAYPGLASKLDQLERQALTEFALATGIQGPPGSHPLAYLGLFASGACNNPFARLA